MADLALLTGAESFLTLVDETDWGTYPDTPTLIHVPVDEYAVRLTPESRNAQPYAGLRQRQHGRLFRGMPSGAITLPLFGWRPTGLTTSLAQYLLTWGCAAPEARFRSSKSANWYEGPNAANRRHTGLRVNQATVSGQEGGPIQLALETMGQNEFDNAAVSTAPTLPTDREKVVEYDFTDATLTIGGTAVAMGGFQWQVQHNLATSYFNSARPVALAAGDTVETLTLTPPKFDESWDERIRDMGLQELSIVLTLKGLHNGTGTGGTTWDQVAITFARASLRDAPTQGGRGVLMHNLTFDLLKPQTSANGSVMAWSET